LHVNFSIKEKHIYLVHANALRAITFLLLRHSFFGHTIKTLETLAVRFLYLMILRNIQNCEIC